MKRGAFHWDSFELAGNNLRYLPSKGAIKDYPKYMKESSVTLSDETVVEIVNELLENKIFELKSTYKCTSSCTSMLEIEISIKNKKKIIHCEDFVRDCPKFLTELENKFITLHGKNLKRILLPG